MPTRLSLTEQYDNRDVVAQIYRLISLVESSTIVDVITSKSDDNVIVTLEMYDGTSKDFMFKANSVQDITASQSGSVETVTITTDDGTKWRFSFDIAIAGMTTDTAQTVTAVKTFTVSPAFPNGLNVAGGVTTPEADIDRLTVGEIDLTGLLRAMGSVTLDGEVQITNGHSLAVAGDISVAEDLQVAGNTELMGDTEIGGMAFEKSGNRTVMSNPNGITVVGQVTEEVPTTSTGLRDLKPANGTRVQNDLDNYAPMLRNTGNYTVAGEFTYLKPVSMEAKPGTRVYGRNNVSGWVPVCNFLPNVTGPQVFLTAYAFSFGLFFIRMTENNVQFVGLGDMNYYQIVNNLPFKLAKDADGLTTLLHYVRGNHHVSFVPDIGFLPHYNTATGNVLNWLPASEPIATDAIPESYTDIIDGIRWVII